MELRRLHIRYLPQGADAPVDRLLQVTGPWLQAIDCDRRIHTDDFDLSLIQNVTSAGDLLLSAAIEPSRSLRVLGLTWQFGASMDGCQVLMNGYQSWTYTARLDSHAVMPGMPRRLARLTEAFAMETGGDYAFATYSDQPGCLHGWTYAVFDWSAGEASRTCLIGGLHEDRGLTLISSDAGHGLISVEPEPPARMLEAGELVPLGGFGLFCTCQAAQVDAPAAGTGEEGPAGYVPSPNAEALYDRWLRAMGACARPARPLVGYTSWYRRYDDIDQRKLLKDLDHTAQTLAALELPGVDTLFQIDDGYALIGDWLQPDAIRFPKGMGHLAACVQKQGMIPGLWCAPFVAEEKSQLVADHPDWLLVDGQGAPVRSGSHWSGHFALDTRKPAVRAYVTTVLRTMTLLWGFRLLKVDFLYAACMLPHDGLNRGQLMADALGLIREAVGPDVLLTGCGVPLGCAFGVVDYCRVGCDVADEWTTPARKTGWSHERVCTRDALTDAYYRAPLDGRAFANDGDAVFLSDKSKLTPQQRQTLLDSAVCNGRVLLTSDNMVKWSDEARAAFQEAILMMAARCADEPASVLGA